MSVTPHPKPELNAVILLSNGPLQLSFMQHHPSQHIFFCAKPALCQHGSAETATAPTLLDIFVN